MADRVLFIGWNRPVVGREQQAQKLFMKAMEFYAKLLAEGRIEGFDTVLLNPHGGDLNGLVILKGTAAKLAEVQRDESFINMQAEGNYCLEGLGVIFGLTGNAIGDFMVRWSKLIGT